MNATPSLPATLRLVLATAVVVGLAALGVRHWAATIAATGDALRAGIGHDEASATIARFAPARALVPADTVVGFAPAAVLRSGSATLPPPDADEARLGDRFVLAQLALAPRRLTFGRGERWTLVDEAGSSEPLPADLGFVRRADLGQGLVLYERLGPGRGR